MTKHSPCFFPGLFKSLLFTILLLCQVSLHAQPPVMKRVLFIGNSFIGVNDLPSLVRTFADHAGVILEYEAFTPGGATVKFLPHGDRSHASNPIVYDLIRSRPWDYIVIQDNQGFFCMPVIGDYGMYNETEKGHMQFRDSLLRSNPCGKMILFSGWVDKDPYAWEPSLGLHTAQEANQKVYAQYKYLNDRFVKQIVSPIGIVWNRVLDSLPHVELFAGDNYHPSYDGSYVTAATLFSTIFGITSEDIPFNGSLPPGDALFIRKAAYAVVRDSLKPTGLSKYVPELIADAGGTLSADPGFASYMWFKNDMLMPGAITNTIPAEPGACYRLTVRDSKGCEYSSLKHCDVITPTRISENSIGHIRLYPNPVKELLHIDQPGLRSICLSDLAGRILYSSDGSNNTIDLSGFAPGIYLLQVADDQGRSGVARIIRE